uniref:Uncharacterized protein n=1 Tax=Anguilla anguilla TaxID=7936 RepID=A0A0E9R8R6_ANGAN
MTALRNTGNRVEVNSISIRSRGKPLVVRYRQVSICELNLN